MSGPKDAYIELSPDDDPDAMAQAMFDAMLPIDPLDGADPSGLLTAQAAFISRLMRRITMRALERDEIIALVERHRTFLEASTMITDFVALAENMPDDEEGMKGTLLMTFRNMEHALNHRPEQIDVFSNRVLYLCIALDLKIRSGRLSHDDAVRGWLDRPAIRELISPLTIRNLAIDYEQTMSQVDDDRPTYVMLLAECALLAGHTNAVYAFSALLGIIPPPADHASWLSLRRRLTTHLAEHNRMADPEDALARAEQRFEERIADDDL